jgi:hypothetical protein
MTSARANAHTLLLPAGELLDFAAAEAFELHLLQRFRNPLLDLMARALLRSSSPKATF